MGNSIYQGMQNVYYWNINLCDAYLLPMRKREKTSLPFRLVLQSHEHKSFGFTQEIGAKEFLKLTNFLV